MARIVWAEPALQDLDAIADYISLDKPPAASRFVRRVFERIEQLATYPKSGSVPAELKGTHYRQLVIPPVRIFYRAQEDTIYIVYVMRGERLFRNDDLLERDMG
ncbi:MAG: type II toxin-antitoxin system RelE/ParE family toxin [Verrucomicrobiota bacterium]|jgi:toxin ParE1/3/4